MSTVTLEKTGDEYSTYTTIYGQLRVRDVELRASLLPNELPIPALWDEFHATATRYAAIRWPSSIQALYLDYLVEIGLLNAANAVAFCAHCHKAQWGDDLTAKTEDGVVCDDCVDDYYTQCPDCARYIRTFRLRDNGRTTLSDETVCENCAVNYDWCDACEGYYHYDDASEHQHDNSSSCCESPQTSFRVRNGDAMLTSDTPGDVTLPERISQEGLAEIRKLLASQSEYLNVAYYAMDELEPQWQTSRGNYTRRLSALAYNKLGIKLPAHITAQVGVIARAHSKAVTVRLDVTRQLNRSASYFYHADSCWWGSYSESRCVLKTNGGFGMRSLDEYNDVTGRAWVMPLREDRSRLEPTFNTETPDAFVVFNGYGELSGYQSARLMAQMTGLTYAKVAFGCDSTWVNGSTGYLVGSQDIVDRYHGSLSLRAYQHADLYETERELAAHAASTAA